MTQVAVEPRHSFTASRFRRSRFAEQLPSEQLEALEVVSRVLPFRTNSYVCGELIDWDRVPEDPIYQLTFPQRGMLSDDQYARTQAALDDPAELERVVLAVRSELNPHPGDQASANVPSVDGVPLGGVQHKYAQTILIFPSRGQTCHAYCSYCFRWPQFVRTDDHKFSSGDTSGVVRYLRAQPEVTDVIITGGDPMTMRSGVLERFLEPLMAPEFAALTLRIGTKAPLFRPSRFIDEADADPLLRLIETWAGHFNHLAVMLHVSHPRELSTDAARQAIRRLRDAGAIIRSQAPLTANVNDAADTWISKLSAEVSLGITPYYMFIPRDTGAHDYFAVTLPRALSIYQDAMAEVSGLAKTLRGPVLSTGPGKVRVLAINDDGTAQVEILQSRYGQPRQPLITAVSDRSGTWLDERLLDEAMRPASSANGSDRYESTIAG